jgi:uncharacterized metal-binding protein
MERSIQKKSGTFINGGMYFSLDLNILNAQAKPWGDMA